MVWAVASKERDDGRSTRDFVDRMGITLPVLWDAGGLVHSGYPLSEAFPSAAFPQEWLIGKDGRIEYVANEYDYDALTEAIDRAFARE